MDTTQLGVALVGLGLMAFVAWFFFFAPQRRATATAAPGGVQEVNITVKGGYSPNLIEVQKGQPVQLNFYRDEDGSCSEELLMPDFNIRRDLPAFRTTAVTFVPREAGRFEFTCGMNMLRGAVVVH